MANGTTHVKFNSFISFDVLCFRHNLVLVLPSDIEMMVNF